ncbi:hypothetical protein [Clostridium estertheticum]|uniref:hypothetical protein n=1 Tax=Clostridium estertheticum TaxID=238834 RepID=UPI001C0C8D35|nr:hypothetical protein [Clostridium estertheticum]MBU3218453.1 hypothetical protein [Clostridium estertheticum]MCB2355744.1 hypothetical protein [Clostridium estertheticum]WAG39333.1 hypothetical protein LL065_13555 [Clostridium estertheticum]WAG55507.1 hypothetical protein LL033_23450 [Clostridium estertheticum]
MYFISVRYKIYEWSKHATILNVLGAILKAFCWICAFSIIMLLVGISTAVNPNYKQDIQFAIPVVVVVGIILSIMGGLAQKKAEKISAFDFENKVIHDFIFAKKMVKKNPQNKDWYMNKNSEYAEYVLSGKEDLEAADGELSDVKKISIGRRLLGVVLAIIFVFGGFYLLGLFN